MLYRYYSQFQGGRIGTALLLLRFTIGLAFIFHGWPKVADISGFASKADVPWLLAAAAAYSELGGGIALILGLCTPMASFLIAVVMSVAMFKVHIPAGHPFVGAGGPSFELAAVYLTAMLAFLMTGPGAYSVDAWLVRQLMRTDETPAVPDRQRAAV